MTQIEVLVAVTSTDVKAKGIAAAVRARDDMRLITGDWVSVDQVDAILESRPSRCALVLVGQSSETDELAQRWLARRDDLVVMRACAPGIAPLFQQMTH